MQINFPIDKRMRLLKARLGYEGIGIYTALLLRLSEEGGYEELNENFIADELRCNTDILHIVLHDFNLFTIKKGTYSSTEKTISEKRREAGRRGGYRSAEVRWGSTEENKQICKQSVSKSKQNNLATNHDAESVFEHFEDKENCKQNISKVVSKSKQQALPLSSPPFLSPKTPIYSPPIIPPTSSSPLAHVRTREEGEFIEAVEECDTVATQPIQAMDNFIPGQIHMGGGRPWEECLYKEGRIWRESIAMRHHIQLSEIDDRIASFLAHQTARGQHSQSRRDALSHFDNWLRIELANERKEKRYETPYQRKERESAELKQRLAKDFEEACERAKRGDFSHELDSIDIEQLY